ncbi:hypothetical protein OS493_037900 [Desmophyllum pertusum]|uniref:Uncharacterized protein n=1 Tax=Desmophyllum pertusum TaxID=174260 RepID=A0A9W9Z6J4_9CNID|nr:hypothetical protein OS493_037900 [Desmophyllum pertusum]
MDSTEKDKPSANSGEEMESDPCPPQSSTESADVNKTAEDIENTDSKELQTETTHDKAMEKTVNPRKRFSDLELTTLDAVFVSSQGNPNRAVVGSTAKALKLSEKQPAPSDQEILTDEAESAVVHSNKENSKDEKPSIVTNPEEIPPLSGSQETGPPFSFNIQSDLEKENTDSKELQTTHDKASDLF